MIVSGANLSPPLKGDSGGCGRVLLSLRRCARTRKKPLGLVRLGRSLALPIIIVACGCDVHFQDTYVSFPGDTFWKEFQGSTMGTHYTVKVNNVDKKETIDLAGARIADTLAIIDGMMSTYKPDSELSRFNQFQSTEPFKVSREMIEIFQAAREVSDATGGAFDVTVGPIVNAWGFGPEKKANPPTDAEIAELLPRVGYTMVSVDANASTLSKVRPDLYCDLSGIAQGYAADEIAAMLDELGVANYMIDISGEFRTRGVNDSGDPWQIAIERPDAPERTAQLVVPLSNTSLATSGDYRNYREENGVRLSHEIDPATGRPVQHKLASATIIIDRCALADAYATALMILGPEKGLALAEEKGLAIYLLVRNDQGDFDEVQSTKFKEWPTK